MCVCDDELFVIVPSLCVVFVCVCGLFVCVVFVCVCGLCVCVVFVCVCVWSLCVCVVYACRFNSRVVPVSTLALQNETVHRIIQMSRYR